MMGLRLRYQISGFLFILFAMVVLIMGYFNASILNDQLRLISLFKSQTTANNVFSILDKTIPQDVTSMEEFIKKRVIFNEFQKYILSVESLRNVELYDSDNKLVYSRLAHENVFTNKKVILNNVRRTQMPEIKVWAVDPSSGKAQEIQSYGVMDTRILLEDHYIPIFRNGKMIGIVHLSIQLQKATRMMRFFFLGNLSLSLLFIITAFIAIFLWSERAINRPLRYLLQAQEQLSRGDFNAHIDIELPSNNELGIIANSFNRMAAELKAYKEALDEKTRKLQEVNEQYRKLNETLEQEVENKTVELKEFFSLITHDLKIPLAAIKGYISLLQKTKTGTLNEKQEHFITAIEISTNHLLNMVRNMLDSVKYDAGKVNYFMEDFDLLQLVEEIESQIHLAIQERSIQFVVDIPEKCRFVYADREKIGNVISNLLSNAINHVPNGGRIELSARDKDEIIEVMVKDNGSGIPAEQIPLIFKKFQQIPGKESPSTSLGLGLYIVSKIMEGHGMKTWVKSEEGKGSEFYFTVRKSINSGH